MSRRTLLATLVPNARVCKQISNLCHLGMQFAQFACPTALMTNIDKDTKMGVCNQ